MTRALALHTRHENDALYPSLHENRPGLAEPFIAEHAEEMDWMVKIDELLEACAPPESRDEILSHARAM